MVVSQTTTLREDPKPVTYALELVYFSLAFIRNMRDGAMETPVLFTTRSSCSTSAGLVFASGSKWLNIGSITSGSTNTVSTCMGSETIQSQIHQCRVLRIRRKTNQNATAPETRSSSSPFPQSRNQLP